MDKAVLIFSGGLDSTTLLYYLKAKGYRVYPITFDYGQRHKKEIEYAQKTAEKFNLPYKIVDITSIKDLISKGSLTGDEDVPHEHYSHESQKQTIVPNRNAILLSIAAGYAITIGAEKVFYAAHSSDKAIYPDCRKEFVEVFNVAMKIGNDYKVAIKAPFVDETKAQIVSLGKSLGVPFEETWSCYEGGEFHCGVCGTCRERKEAFEIAKVNDPTIYGE